MTYCQSDSMSQFYPVDDLRIILTLSGAYFLVDERHRHQSGRWGECRCCRYDSLTWAESLDVLDAIGQTLLPQTHPSELRSTL